VGKRRALVALVAVVVAGWGAVAPASAANSGDKQKKQQRQQQIGKQIDSLRDQVDEASTEESNLLGQIDASRARLADLTARVGDLNARLAVSQRALDGAESKLAAQRVALDVATRKLHDLAHELSRSQQELKQRAVDVYVGQDADAESAVLLNVKSQRDIVALEGYSSFAIDAQQAAIDRVDQLREQADQAAKQVEVATAEARRQRDAVAAQTVAVQRQRDDQAAAQQQVADETTHESALLDQVQAKKADFEAQIASLQAESDSISAFLRSLPSSSAGGGIVVSGNGFFSIPVPGAPMTSPFGPRMHPIFHTIRMHTGQDFGAPYGAAVHAAADGTVVKAGWLGGYGNATVIDHGNGLATLYGHQSRIVVSEGQHVVRGQVIGYVGSTGFSTGPHMHFEVRVNGTPVDPRKYL
jgi:murein DD-endopeptidase MepM/ murein hydrolase activator NlpD